MHITPQNILDKEFARRINGYDRVQVDEFLDEIIKQFESLIEENENMVAKNEELKNEVARLRTSNEKSGNMEDRLMSTVLSAQRNATLYLERAEAQATKIMDIANQNARTILESTHLRMDAIRQEIAKYERVLSDYKKRFRMLLEEQAAFMDAYAIGGEQLTTTAQEVGRSLANLEQQMHELDETAEQDSMRINDILREAHEERDLDFSETTSNLQAIVDDIIDD